MDAYIRGEYTESVLAYLKRQGLMFDIQPGDMELIKKAPSASTSWASTIIRAPASRHLPPGAARRSKQNNKIGKGCHVVYEVQPDLFEGCKNEFIGDTDFSMPIDPVGPEYVLEDINDRYHIPVMICENGFGAYDKLEKDGSIHDPYRIEYIREHIKAMKAAIANGVKLLGYNPSVYLRPALHEQRHRQTLWFCVCGSH